MHVVQFLSIRILRCKNFLKNQELVGKKSDVTLDDPPEISCKDLAKIASIRKYLQES